MEDISKNLNTVLELANKETEELNNVYFNLNKMNEVLNDFANDHELKTPLSFVAQSSNADNKVGLHSYGSPSAVTLEYSTNGVDWSPYVINTDIPLPNAGDSVYFRGDNVSLSPNTAWNNYYYFSMSGALFNAYGNIMSLLDKKMQKTSVPDFCFFRLFLQCYNLVRAPKLPATSIGSYGYSVMFRQSAITAPPDLPATTLGTNAYNGMFQQCYQITKSPYLPATTLTTNCYGWMFSGCSNLTEVSVAFTTWNTSATNTWFENDTQWGIFKCPLDLDTEEITRNASTIPSNWTVVNI